MNLRLKTTKIIRHIKHHNLYLIAFFSICISSYGHSQVSTPSVPQSQQEVTAPKEIPPVLAPDIKENPNHSEPPAAPTYGSTVVKMVLTLAGLFGLAAASLWMVKKMTQGRLGAFGKKHIQILEKRPLSPKTLLYVVEFAGKKHLIAESQLEVKALANVDITSEED